MRISKMILAVLSMLCCLTAKAQTDLVINEIMAANLDTYVDPSWNYGGWVELYNPGNNPVQLQGYWVSDDPKDLKKRHLTQSMIVPGNGFLNLWFDHHDKYCETQVNMKLDTDGEAIYLSDPEGNLVVSQEYPTAIPRASWARIHDGADEWGYTNQCTPSASNGDLLLCTLRLPAPEPDVESTLFDKDKALTTKIEIPEGATLRYTTDGSTPTLENGETSTDGIFTVTNNTIFRFAFFQEGFLSSPVITRSYLLRDKDFSLPIMSLCTDPDNLYSDEMGIFVDGVNGRPCHQYPNRLCNWMMDWDRPANFEFLDKNGKSLVNQETEILRCGGWSRDDLPYSFKVHAVKTCEGKKTLDYPFFEDKPYLRHKMLQIRNGGNDTECRVIDAFIQKLILTSGFNVDVLSYQPIAHYINGMYYGVINMREPSNKQYVYANYGYDDDEIDFFELSSDSCEMVKCGTSDAFDKLFDLSSNAARETNYTRIKELLDVDEFCNYIALQLFLGNWDWPKNNTKWWRPAYKGGRFRYILFDLDYAFDLTPTSRNNKRDKDPFTELKKKQYYRFNTPCDMSDREVEELGGDAYFTHEIRTVSLFLNLMKNKEFRKQFINTFCIVGGSIFNPTRCTPLINEWAKKVESMQILPNEYNNPKNPYYRCKIVSNESSNTSQSPWDRANFIIDKLRNRQQLMCELLQDFLNTDFAENPVMRKIKLSSNVSLAHISIGGQIVPTGSFNGYLFPTSIYAEAPAGYVFDGWKEVNSTSDEEYYSEDEEITLPNSDIELQACFSRDKDYPTVRPVVINEVSAANSIYVNEYFKRRDWIELYNTSNKPVNIKGMALSDDPSDPYKYIISSEGSSARTIIPAHSYRIIWCDEEAPKTDLHAPFKLANDEGASIILTAADGSWSDTFTYTGHNGDESVGRFPDGSDEIYVMSRPSINGSNYMTSNTEYLRTDPFVTGIKQPSRSGGLGLFIAPDGLHIKSEDDAKVHLIVCTLGGQEVMSQDVIMEDGHAVIPVGPLAKDTYVAKLSDSVGNSCAIKFQTSHTDR